jgi:DMSO reductase family type II enzyme chaperone
MMEVISLQSDTAQRAANRSRMYQLLGATFAFPDEDFFAAIHDGTFATTLGEMCRGLPYDLSTLVGSDLAAADTPYADFESEYIRLFDVGPAGPPCPLHGGVYIGDRMKVMEDATRFYNFFHLRLSSQMRELPDHVTTELEFLHYLTFREAEACQHGLDVSSLLRAERDFLARHLCKWMPKLQLRLAKQTTLPFFPALVRFAAAFLAADHAYAAATAE